MGNQMIPEFDSPDSSRSSSTPSSPAITQSTSNEGTHLGNGQILPTPNLRIFTFAELKTATTNFGSDMFLGEGRFGRVFQGWIHKKTFAPAMDGNGLAIAVNRLQSEGFQGRREWQSEVNILGSLSHPNLVRLLGHCEEDKELLLVYEFLPRGSLANHLFSTK